jgi:3'(2'), 5'-bisphosphate nucleotidase
MVSETGQESYPTVSNRQLQAIIALAEEAGEAIMSVYGEKDFGVSLKSGQSPLTRADMAAHHVIVAGLEAIQPNLPVISEESKTVAYEERRHWGAYWLVDPLDGTKEFIKREGEFTVNVALIQNGNPLLGVVHAPTLHLTYFAALAEGAFRQKSGQSPVKIRVNKEPDSKLKIVASRSHISAALERFLGKLENYECLNMGSSLKFCLIAEGAADLYPRLGPTMEWDTAAGQCIVEAAGGTVTTLQGMRLSYNKPELLNPDFIVCSTPSIQWQRYLEGSNQSKTSNPH